MANKKKALLVGINDYAPLGAGGPDLKGCVNDIKDIANTLVICGFQPGSIKILTDNRATKANIISSIKWLLDGSTSGDSIVFYYSGHGSYVVDSNGDEPDHIDEIICPHDWPQYISDDELSVLFGNIPDGVNLEVIMDCCYSGTNTRAILSIDTINETKLLTPRFIKPPFDFEFYKDFKYAFPNNSSRPFSDLSNINTKRDVVSNLLNHCLWSACNDKQLANEIAIETGYVRGIFTYHFCQILKATSGNISREKLDLLLTAALSRYGYDQTPQLEGRERSLINNIFE